jgi:predicted O-methyltransferase YrrM
MSWQDLTGWFDWPDLYDKILDRTPEYGAIVEVGVAHGRSIAYLAQQAIDHKRLVSIYGVDRWLYVSWATFMGGMRACAAEELDYITPLRHRSCDAARAFTDGTLDAVFIDACHDYASVARDIELWLPKVIKGGIIAGHDYSEANWPGVVQAVQERFGKVPVAGANKYCWWVEV